MPYYLLLAVSPALIGLAVVLAVIRAPKNDLVEIVRALMRIGPRGNERDDRRGDDSAEPPALPKS